MAGHDRPLECRHCGMLSPPSALTCDCGAALGRNSPAPEPVPPASRGGRWEVPLALFFVGLVVMFVSAVAIEPGSAPMKAVFFLGAGVAIAGGGLGCALVSKWLATRRRH